MLTLTEGRERRSAGATATAAGPPSSSLWAAMPGLERARSSPVVGAEYHDVGVLLHRELVEALAGRGVEDDVARHVGRADLGGASGQQLFGLLLLVGLALVLGQVRVADVGERELTAGVGEQPAEGEGVAVVVGVVVGNDDLRGHGVLLVIRR